MAGKIGGTDEYNSDINVTPMVDVMLVLLIIFMIVTPLLQQGVTVNIPKELNSPEEDAMITKDTSVVISIPNNSDFYIGKDPYPIDELGERVNTLMKDKTAEEKIVYIKSGIDVDYGTVVKAIDTIRKQEIDKIGLVADKKKGTPAAPAAN
jgi:biopolymer transport protein ExbD/biopolymer transport protein TolR